MNLFLRRISAVVIYNGLLNKGQLSTATKFDGNEYRNRYVNFPIIILNKSVCTSSTTNL